MCDSIVLMHCFSRFAWGLFTVLARRFSPSMCFSAAVESCFAFKPPSGTNRTLRRYLLFLAKRGQRFGPLSSEVDQSLLEKPAICDHMAPPCSNGLGMEPVTVDAYVFHPGRRVGPTRQLICLSVSCLLVYCMSHDLGFSFWSTKGRCTSVDGAFPSP